MYGRGNVRPNELSRVRLGTRADSTRMSPPDDSTAASFSPLTAVTDSGTSLMFSAFFWAVTITSPTVATSSAAAAGAAKAMATTDAEAQASRRWVRDSMGGPSLDVGETRLASQGAIATPQGAAPGRSGLRRHTIVVGA